MEFLYLAIALFSTTIGALSGLGGGVIIKPVLDAVAPYDAATIGLISSFTVFSMAMVSTVRQYMSGIRFEGKKSSFIVAGSITGGIAGKFLFTSAADALGNSSRITAVQSLLLASLLGLVFLYLLQERHSSLHINNGFIITSAGFLLGLIAAFLGVGGGPFNVVLLTLLFSMDSRTAAVHSVLIILFSQSAKLAAVLVSGGFGGYDLSALIFMIPGGVGGGLIGAWLNHKLKSRAIQILFRIVVALLILLNLYNFSRAVF
ncbi:MAG: sulfite exporter TauE/SafE family protein [Spirochaetales bacterium]|nr:sulfite exporter TauE/SafE family protein [Spirochaetales bacterium]